MTLEDQVVSLELAKKLKELGVLQESLFYWTTNNLSFTDDKCSWILEAELDTWDRRIPAYTVAELGEMLPTPTQTELQMFWRKNGQWTANYEDRDGNNQHFLFEISDTEADARARCLIYLLENNLIQHAN